MELSASTDSITALFWLRALFSSFFFNLLMLCEVSRPSSESVVALSPILATYLINSPFQVSLLSLGFLDRQISKTCPNAENINCVRINYDAGFNHRITLMILMIHAFFFILMSGKQTLNSEREIKNILQ